jgi:8-oxo-dGTP diphosphatase
MRIRVAAIIVDAGRVLLVSTKGGRPGYLVPPGGGVEEGEALAAAVEREVREEAGLVVQAGPLLAYRELRTRRGLALELYFGARLVPTDPASGADTEGRQVCWVALDDLPTQPHFPEQLGELACPRAAGDAGACFLGRADLRPATSAASTTERKANRE